LVVAPRTRTGSGSREGLLPARLILGRPLGIVQPRRSRLVSVPPAWHSSVWSDHQEEAVPQFRAPRQTLRQIVLPAPGVESQRWQVAGQVAADFLLLTAAFAIVQLVPCHGQPLAQRVASCNIGTLLLYGAIFTLLGYSERLYDRETLRMPTHQALLLLKVFVWSTFLIVLTLVSWKPLQPSLLKFVCTGALGCTLMLLYRQCVGRSPRRQPSGKSARNVLIIGSGQVGRKLAHSLQQDPVAACTVCGFLDEDLGGKDVLGRVQDLEAIARHEFVDEIIITVPPHSDVGRKAIWQARRNHIDVKIVPDLLGANPALVTLEQIGDIPVMTLCCETIPVFRLLVKRVADMVLSGIGLLFTAPLLSGIAFAIKMDSPGPAFYRAPRVGLKGKRFLCCKFRTMVVNADRLKDKLREHNERAGPFFKLAADPRVTRVGRFLRRYSLDELPQLWNVFMGEMSLVGPRPHPIDDVQRYELEDYQRLEATPGLTGLWQVTARQDPSFQRSMALDREYIGRWSLGMDLRILCKTIAVVMRGEGA